jgi:hypothetical protein
MNLFLYPFTLILMTTKNLCTQCISQTLKQLLTNPKDPQPCPSHPLLKKSKLPFAADSKLMRGLHSALQAKVLHLFLPQSGWKSNVNLPKDSQGDSHYLWTIPTPFITLHTMLTRTTRQGSNALKKIDEIRLLKIKKNNKLRKQQEEEEKRKKDEAEKEERAGHAKEGANQDQE